MSEVCASPSLRNPGCATEHLSFWQKNSHKTEVEQK